MAANTTDGIKTPTNTYILGLIMAGLSCFLAIQAETPDIGGAKNFATAFFNNNKPQRIKGETLNATPISMEYVSHSTVRTPVFAYQQMGGGFALVAQSNHKFVVVGYSPNGKFNKEGAPPMLMELIKQYEDSLEITGATEVKSKSPIAPLLDTKNIALDQYLHEYAGGCATGCVATAFAQIMAYHQFPDKGVGSHCYTDPKYGKLCADFENTTYNWNNPTDDDYKLLSSHVGIAMDMQYCADIYGSSAGAPDYLYTLQKYFKYYILRTNSSIDNELENGRPVYIELRGNPPHAAVVDGRDENGWYHINFGWGGHYSGFYPLFDNSVINVGYKFGSNVIPTYVTREKPHINKADSLVLVQIHHAFQGATGWDLNESVLTWGGVDFMNDRVVGLYIWNEDFNTTSHIPDAIATLTELKSLTISAVLTGTLTSEISKLTKLREISIRNLKEGNDFSFTITPDIGNLVMLERLKVDGVKGILPASIGNLTKLTYLELNNSYLTGTIPAEMGNLTNLNTLDLKNNQLSGIVPASMGKLSKIERLDLSHNSLSAIQDGAWNCPKLIWLYLSNNQLVGTLPASFSTFESLTTLELENNQLTAVPGEIGLLEKLNIISLDSNQLTEIPEQWMGLYNLTTLSANNNHISKLPMYCNWLNLHSLFLNDNKLEYFPNSLCLLPRLGTIELRNNKIKRFPEDAALLSRFVGRLDLRNNEIMDYLPVSLMQDSTILLRLDSNYLVHSHIPRIEGIKIRLNEQKQVQLSQHQIKVMIGDTVRLNIKQLYPYSLPDDKYIWIPFPKYPTYGYEGVMQSEQMKEDSILTIVISNATIQQQFYCKIVNFNSPHYSYNTYYQGSYYTSTGQCLEYLNTEPVSFVLTNEKEKFEANYPESRIVSSTEIPTKIVEDKIVTLTPPRKMRGTLQWQASADGKTWYDLSNNMSQTDLKANLQSIKSEELILSPKTPAYYRCALKDINCEPLYSDTIRVNPFGKVLYNQTINVADSYKTVSVDSIEVTIPQNITEGDFRLTIVKMDNPPPAPKVVTMGSVYDVTVSFGDVFNYPLLIKMRNVDKAAINYKAIDNYKAVYYDEPTQQWIKYNNTSFSAKDSCFFFETNHLTKLSIQKDADTKYGYTDEFKTDNIRVVYKDTDVVVMASEYDLIQTPQLWHQPDYPWYVQDVAHYLGEVMKEFEKDNKLPIPSGIFTVYIENMSNDGLVGIMGMIKGYMTIHRNIKGPEKLRSLLAHEFMHYTQDAFIAAHGGNTFWMEATAHLTDRMVWDESVIPQSESDLYLLDGTTNANSIFDFLAKSWDYWDSSFLTQGRWGNIYHCYQAGTFLHYMRSYREGEKKLKPDVLLKETSYFGSWRDYLSSYISKHLGSTIGDEYEAFIKYILEGSNENFNLHLGDNPFGYLVGNSANKGKDNFAKKIVYKFPATENKSQKDKVDISMPYLSSRVFMLYNSADDRPLVVTYKRLHDKDPENKVYLGTYNANSKQIEYVDITEVESHSLFLEQRNTKTNKEYKNICFLLFINKQNPGKFSFGSDFDASFEITATPVLNIENLALATLSDKSIHTYTNNRLSHFTISGCLDYTYALQGTGVDYSNFYDESSKSNFNDSTYTVEANYYYVLTQEYFFNAPTTRTIFDLYQTLVYNYLNQTIDIKQNLKKTTEYNTWYESPSNAIKLAYIRDITEEVQTMTFKNMLDFKLVNLPTIDDAIQFSTKNTVETIANIDNISHTIKTTQFDSSGGIISIVNSNYISTDYSQGEVKADVFLHYK